MFGDQAGVQEFRAKFTGGLWAEAKGIKDSTQVRSPALFGRAPLGVHVNGTVDIGPWDQAAAFRDAGGRIISFALMPEYLGISLRCCIFPFLQ